MNYLDKLKHLTQRPDTDHTIRPGALIAWTRGDGSQPEGFVDLIHVDDTGTRWAFVSLPGGTWAVVNVKFLKEVNP